MRTRSSKLALAGVVALTGLRGAPASAAEPPTPSKQGGVEFRWDAPAQGCPSEDEVLAEIERLLGGPVHEQGERRLAAIARVRLEADGHWDLRLWTVTEDATRQRSMIGEDCAVLADAAALLAAMAIDPTVLERQAASEAAVEQAEQAQDVDDEPPPEPEPEPELEPEPEPEPELLPEPEPEPEPEPTPRAKRGFELGVGAAAGISLGDLPGVGAVARLGLALQWAKARLELEAHYAFLRRARFDDADDLGADLRMASAALRGCGVLRHRPAKLEFPICAGLEAGAQLGNGVGFVVVNEGAIPWLAADVSAGLAWTPIPQLALGLRVEPFVPLIRPRFEADGFGEIWRPLPVGFRALAGLEARF